MNATIPLEEVLPWSYETPRTILIGDSIETDGRFLLYTVASQVLKGGQNVWWLTACAVTEKQIATGLKKIGCDVAASYLRNSGSSLLKITSMTAELAHMTLDTTTDHGSLDGTTYLKDMYKQIKTWLETGGDSCHWIILDDISSLAEMVDDHRLVFQFVDSICSLAKRTQRLGVILRCSLELDQAILKAAQIEEVQDKTGWLGAGGSAQKLQIRNLHQTWIPWERTIESMDIVVDIVPLSSGYSREAHGRLVFTEYPGGRGWGISSSGAATKQGMTPSVSSWNKFVINYCLQDAGVRAIRLRESTSTA